MEAEFPPSGMHSGVQRNPLNFEMKAFFERFLFLR